MKIEYDKKVDALYVAFKKGKIAKTLKVGTNFLADVDRNGNILGLEILDASRSISSQKPTISIGNKTVSLPTPIK